MAAAEIPWFRRSAVPERSHETMRSVDRVAAILNFLGEESPQPIWQIAAETGLPRPTVFRLVKALARQGFVMRDDGVGYRLGPRLMFLAMKSSGAVDLKSAARPVMEWLARETGETTALQLRVGSSRVCVELVESSQMVRRVIEVNTPMPVHCGASGKALLAWLPEARAAELIGKGPLQRFTEHTITDPDELMAELRAIRKVGYAISFGERMGDGNAIAAPILSSTGEVLGAVAVLAPAHRTPRQKLIGWVPVLQRAGREIAAAHGAVPLG